MTVLFADVVDSTGLGERLDPEVLRSLMDSYFRCVQSAVEAHGGIVEKFIGDAVMAVFGIPQTHEDDALRAIRAGMQIQKEIAVLNQRRPDDEPIRARVGINSGEVLTASGGDGKTGIVGDPVNAAARLEKLAEPGGVVVGGPTFRLVRGAVVSQPLGPVSLRGREELVEAHVVVAVDAPAAQSRNFDAPMVGRTRELEALRRTYERVAEDRICALFTLLGPAGIGKSRLVAEFSNDPNASPQVLTGRCLPYGDGITFWPITEVISSAAQISDRDSQEHAVGKLAALVEGIDDAQLIANLVAQLMGFSDQTGSQEETFWAVRKLFEALAAEGPVVVVLDDIHWAEATLLDLIDHIVDRCSDSPILIACLARPELLEARPTWAGGKLNATTIFLEPLRDAESNELFTRLLGDAGVIETLMPRIIEVSGGNPLFFEETVAMLIDEGVIEQSDGSWIARTDVQQIAIPPTINALLAARLDQLPQQERNTIELAALMGKVFASQAIRDLSGDESTSTTLDSLSRKGMLRLDQEEFAGEEMYRFRHILIRDAAYQVIPKERRGELHERYAYWLLEVLGDRSTEYEEIIGYHFEQAFRYMRELRADEQAIDNLGRRAGATLHEAGRRAAGRDDTSAAVNLLTRAVDVLPAGDSSSPYVLLDLAAALMDQGDYGSCEKVLAQAIQRAVELGEPKAEARGRLQLVESHIHTRQKSADETRVASEDAIRIFEELDDSVGLAQAWRLLSYAFDTIGKSKESQEAMTNAISHAEATGDENRAHLYRQIQIRSLSWSPIPISQLLEKTSSFLAQSKARSDRRGEALALGILAAIEACRGRAQESHELLAKQNQIYDELGLDLARAWGVFEAATVEILAGDLGAAESALRRSCEILEAKQEKAVLPTVMALLADVTCSRGDLGESEQLLEKATTLAVHDDLLTQIKCRTVSARIKARKGSEAEALALVREGIEIAEATEYLDWRAGAWMDMAEIAETFGLLEEAKSALARAIDLFERKEMALPARRATERLAKLGA